MLIRPQSLSRLARRLTTLIYPPHCQLCGDSGSDGQDICADCRKSLAPLATGCVQCALPLPVAGVFCGRCLRTRPAYDQVSSPFVYAPPLDSLVKRLKFQRKLSAGRLLSELMAEHMAARRDPLPALLIPVPLHRKRLLQRGFNQATELARPLGRRLGIAVDAVLLHRVRHTEIQSELPSRARRRNVRGAFAVRPGVTVPDHVAIVDDVMTTGHTVNEVARLLRRSGVQRIEVWVAARALIESGSHATTGGMMHSQSEPAPSR